MKKLLVVLAVLALGSLASAQLPISLSFTSYTGGLTYCNCSNLSAAPSFGASAVQGEDDLKSACGGSVDATVAGATGGGKFIDVTNGTGKKVTIKGVVYADNLYDAFSLAYTGDQWFVAQNLKAEGTSSKKFGWIGLASVSGSIFGDNFGHLIPGVCASRLPHSNKTTTGQSR